MRQSAAGAHVISASAPSMLALPALVRNGATPAGAGPRYVTCISV